MWVERGTGFEGTAFDVEAVVVEAELARHD